MDTVAPNAQDSSKVEQTSRRWLLAFFGLSCLLIAVNAFVAYRMDIYGIFRDSRGRALVTSEHERKGKFLLNQAYVPVNFDALIIGASSQVNWHADYLTGYRFYNESIEGGDASEERRLVEQALPHGHFKVALVGFYPRTTQLHVLQDGFDQVERSEAFGSINSLGTEYDIVMDRIRHRSAQFFPDGSHVLPIHKPPTPDSVRTRMSIDPDPVAVEDYRALIQELAASGTRIVYVIDPLYDPQFQFNRGVYEQYKQFIHTTMPPAPVIDFNAPEYTEFRKDANNFIDDVHLSATGAETISHILNERLQQVLNTK
jgi:hypothetical protein